MIIASLSIGDELMLGEVVDTNAGVIAARLYAIGLKVHQHLAVGDREIDIMEALEVLTEKCDAVIVTGGLGPTVDDVTARAVAKVSGRRLILNEEALAHLNLFFEKYQMVKHSANDKQALLPARSTLIPNPLGTACGFALTHKGRSLFFLPGVPAEMTRMLDESIIPYLEERTKPRPVVMTRVLKVFGLSEAEVGAIIDGMTTSFPGIATAYCVNYPEILVKFRGEGDKAVYDDLAEIVTLAGRKLQGYVFAEDNETMDSVVASLFRATGATLSLAESCTGGMIAARITELPGSSAFFLEGTVAYSNAAKMQTLHVTNSLLEEHGAVSSEAAMAMARGVRSNSGSDIALAVTGIAGPEGGTPEKPVGTVFIALADKFGCWSKRYLFHGDRASIRLVTAFTALDWLRRHLISMRAQ